MKFKNERPQGLNHGPLPSNYLEHQDVGGEANRKDRDGHFQNINSMVKRGRGRKECNDGFY